MVPGPTRNGGFALNTPSCASSTRPPVRDFGKTSTVPVRVPSALEVTWNAGSGKPPGSRLTGSAQTRVTARFGGNLAPVATVTAPARPTPGVSSTVGVSPVPRSTSVCTAVTPLSSTMSTRSTADRAPGAFGVKVTEIRQICLGFSTVQLEDVTAKSPAGSFTTATPSKVTRTVPMFDTVTLRAGLVVSPSRAGKVSGAGLKPSVVLRATPVPTRATETAAALPCALCSKVSAATRLPTAPGVKVTGTWQDWSRSSVTWRHAMSENTKSAAFAPDLVILVILNGPRPVFVQVTVPFTAPVPRTTRLKSSGDVHWRVDPGS